MKIKFLLLLAVSACSFHGIIAQNSSTSESLNVKHFDDLNSSLSSEIAAKLATSSAQKNQYASYLAKNNGSISLKNKKSESESMEFASTTFENTTATNSSKFAAPTTKNTVYELLSKNNGKEYFPEIAFLDANTLVTIAFSKQNATLLFIDISGSQMKVTSKINVPVDNVYNSKTNSANRKELFFIDSLSHTVVIPVNKRKEAISKDGELCWKKSKTVTPGIWIIRAIKNDEKKWSFNNASIQVNYFYSSALSSKGKSALQVQTAHADNNKNIWLSFTQGIVGVLANVSKNEKTVYNNEIKLHNFNKDYSWYDAMRKDYSTLLYEDLKGSVDPDENDTTDLQKRYFQNPQAFSAPYLENAKYVIQSNILREKNNELDSNSYFENAESLTQFVHLELDDPTAKSKKKTVSYFGFEIKQFQTIQNSITTDNDGAAYITTNLGLHKLSFDAKSNSIKANWSLPYKNSFIKETGNKVASSQTTPTFIADKNEIVFCDNAFPTKNMMIIDAATGNVKYRFRLFEYAVGSACENAVSYSNNTILISNTFGNVINGYAAKGIMRFNCTETGLWKQDYEWNKLHVNTLCNTASVKISGADEQAYIYENGTDAAKWQFTAIKLNAASEYNKIVYSLSPDFKGVAKFNLNNNKSNFVFGSKHSMFIGTTNGLLRIMSE
ncbi:MAG: hypothetical protein U0U67_09855 [Chitinophagales bacterium]